MHKSEGGALSGSNSDCRMYGLSKEMEEGMDLGSSVTNSLDRKVPIATRESVLKES